MRDGFIIHEKTLKQIRKMQPEQIGELILAMTAHYDGTEAGEVSQLTEILMVDVAERMDADAEAYEKSVEQKKAAAAKRWRSDADAMRSNADGMRTDADAMRSNADGMRTVCGDDAGNAVSVSDSVSVSENKKREKRFAPPSPEELAEYIRENGYQVNPTAFLSYYESNGWKVGKNPMKDWKAAVRTWAQRDKGKAPPGNKPSETSGRKYDFATMEKAILTGGRK